MSKVFLIFYIVGFVSGCTNLPLSRHPSSGYTNYADSDFREAPLENMRDDMRDDIRSDTIAENTREIPLEITRTNADHNRSVASLIEQNDIALGMQKDAVRDSWGDPDYVEVSGHPKFENERWRFSHPIATPEGYHIEERFVYFESGRVVGWSTR